MDRIDKPQRNLSIVVYIRYLYLLVYNKSPYNVYYIKKKKKQVSASESQSIEHIAEDERSFNKVDNFFFAPKSKSDGSDAGRKKKRFRARRVLYKKQ